MNTHNALKLAYKAYRLGMQTQGFLMSNLSEKYAPESFESFCTNNAKEFLGEGKLVIRDSRLTGETHVRVMNITNEELKRWRNGELIQSVWPQLSADDREFLMTGTTAEEWKDAYGDEE